MIPIFKRIKNESGDDMLKFVIAKADSIDALERYRGKCEPSFLFYAGGVLVEVVHGADSPAINRSIIEQLAKEHKVLEGIGTRIEIIDPKFPPLDPRLTKQMLIEEDQEQVTDLLDDGTTSEVSTDEEEQEARRIFIAKEETIIIINHLIHAENKTKEIIQKIKNSGFEIDDTLEKTITIEEAIEYYNKTTSAPIEDLITAMTGGPSFFIILSKKELSRNLIHDIKELLGPMKYNIAKETAPLSLIAQYGLENDLINGFLTSDTLEDAKREIQIFFPNFVSRKISVTDLRPPTEYSTFGIIRADAYAEAKDRIINELQTRGYKIIGKKEFKISQAEVKYFYQNLMIDDFAELAECMARGPNLAMVLSNNKSTIVEDWLNDIGPWALKGDAVIVAARSFRILFQSSKSTVNQFHGSLTEESAYKEIMKFFPVEQTVVIIKPNAIQYKDLIMQVIRENGFFIASCLICHIDSNQFHVIFKPITDPKMLLELEEYMLSKPSCFLIASKINAIARMRELFGVKTLSIIDQKNEASYSPLFSLPIKLAQMNFDSSAHIIEGVNLINSDNRMSSSTSKTMNNSTQQNMLTKEGGDNEQAHFIKIEPEMCTNVKSFIDENLDDLDIVVSRSFDAARKEIEILFGDVKFDKDGFMKKKKRPKKGTVCHAKGKQTTKEEENIKVNDSTMDTETIMDTKQDTLNLEMNNENNDIAVEASTNITTNLNEQTKIIEKVKKITTISAKNSNDEISLEKRKSSGNTLKFAASGDKKKLSIASKFSGSKKNSIISKKIQNSLKLKFSEDSKINKDSKPNSILDKDDEVKEI